MTRSFRMIDSAGMLGANLVAEELLTGVRAKKSDGKSAERGSINKERQGGHRSGQKVTVPEKGSSENPRHRR